MEAALVFIPIALAWMTAGIMMIVHISRKGL